MQARPLNENNHNGHFIHVKNSIKLQSLVKLCFLPVYWPLVAARFMVNFLRQCGQDSQVIRMQLQVSMSATTLEYGIVGINVRLNLTMRLTQTLRLSVFMKQ